MKNKWIGSSILAVFFLGFMVTQAHAVATLNITNSAAQKTPKLKIHVTTPTGTQDVSTQEDNEHRRVGAIIPDEAETITITNTETNQTYIVRRPFSFGQTLDLATLTPMAGAATTSAASTADGAESWNVADYFKSGEFYVAGLIGYNLPNSFSSVQSTQQPGLQISNLNLQNNPIYEGKLGYYFPPIGEKVRLGGEISYSFTNPNIKQQPITATFAGSSFTTDTTPGAHVRLSTFAYHFLARYDGLGDWLPALKGISPYGGIGPAIGWFRAASGPDSAANTTLGYSAVYGVRWQTPLEHVAFWLEGSHRSFSPTFGKDFQLKGDYSDNAIKIGVSVYFTGDKSAW